MSCSNPGKVCQHILFKPLTAVTYVDKKSHILLFKELFKRKQNEKCRFPATLQKTRSRSRSIKLTQIDKEVIPLQFCKSNLTALINAQNMLALKLKLKFKRLGELF